MAKSFNEFMSETKPVNRWTMFSVAIMGAFCGALLTVAFMMVGLV